MYLISGSEDGTVYVWDIFSATQLNKSEIDVACDGPVSCVAWNPKYNMIAVGSFGDEWPICLFVSQKSGKDYLEEQTRAKDEILIEDQLESQPM